MTGGALEPPGVGKWVDTYRLDDQIGFILRRAHQRHTAIFAREIAGELTTTQFAALARLHEFGDCSQNRLGRLIAVDAATIKGVVERLQSRGLVETSPDPDDRRRTIVSLTAEGKAQTRQSLANAAGITEKTLQPLNASERRMLLALLRRIT